MVFGLGAWSSTFWHLFVKDFEDEQNIKSRKERTFGMACLAAAVLFVAGICGWYSLFILFGFHSDGGTWSDDVPFLLLIAISPAYSLLKWMSVR